MMAKYHVGSSGPGLCKASVKPCPLGGEEVHFPSKREAAEAYDKQLKDEYGTLMNSVQKKAGKDDEMTKLQASKKSLQDDEKALDAAWQRLSETNDADDREAMAEAWEHVKDSYAFRGYSSPDDFADTHDMFDALAAAQDEVAMDLDEVAGAEERLYESY